MRILLLIFLLLAGKTNAQSEQRLHAIVNAYYQIGLFNGNVQITEKGKTIFAGSYGYADMSAGRKNTAATRFNAYSITKPVTATVLLKLVAEGKLNLDQRLSSFYPSMPGSDSITIRHLLSHTSGIYNYNNDFSMPVGSEKEMIDWLEKKPLDFKPGSQFRYSNTGYFLLGFIIEKVTGMSYEAAVRQYVLSPAGMQESGFDLRTVSDGKKAKGYMYINGKKSEEAPVWDYRELYSAGGMYTTTADLQRFHRVLQDGKLLPDSLMQLSDKPCQKNYGLGWFVDSIAGKKIVSHSGGATGFRSYLIRDVANDICIVLLSNSEMSDIVVLRNKLLAELNGQPYDLPKNIKRLQQNFYKYEGAYNITNSLTLYLHRGKGMLMATTNKGRSSVLLPAGKDDMMIEAIGAYLSFKNDSLIFSQKGETVTVPRLKAGWGITGSATENGWGGRDVEMQREGKKWIARKVRLKEGVIKFRYNNDWVLNYGQSNVLYLCKDGKDIKVAPGTYKIVLDLTDEDKVQLHLLKE
ncbi:MAG: serine hydrolase [Terrimonas ferruginea]|uniref:serine hydrolase n=1 Tax=Terrimonas ferruginea TaxID=249 RepID=UPI000AF54779|nr:serine hydrolase [Terrimonas ferruginea]MBN8784049.1 serine hydrolase [Terrimonas ferruginea]